MLYREIISVCSEAHDQYETHKGSLWTERWTWVYVN